jgi:hypothetical protein
VLVKFVFLREILFQEQEVRKVYLGFKDKVPKKDPVDQLTDGIPLWKIND